MAEGQKKEIIKQRFGRYLLLDHLVDGGMAKICRARHLGEQADKIVAVKMIQPQYSSDEAFKTMFMDEIKVAFGLIHPNIAQTYDYGIENGQLFTVMEYVDGKNLKQFLDKLREKKFVFPVEICLHITAQACQALHYAHTLTDKLTGNAYKIVHRDISPHNLMITYDGAVKVIDFGIAKASTNSEATQAGTIKGKLSYLAPEYLEGLELDHRYDQFALGITLWEMLCNRKLFKAENDLAVLKQIQTCKIPAPSSINPNVSKELDEIVLKALSKDREKRFKDMDMFNRELVKFLYSHYQIFNPSDLAYFAKDLFQEEIRIDRERFFEFGKIDIRPFLEEVRNNSSPSVAVKTNPSISKPNVTQTQLKKKDVVEFEMDDDLKQEMDEQKKTKGLLSPNASKTVTPKDLGTGSGSSNPSLDKKVERTKPFLEIASPTKLRSSKTTQVTRKTSIDEIKQVQDEKKKSKKSFLIAASLLCFAFIGYNYMKNTNEVSIQSNSTTSTPARSPSSDQSVKNIKKGFLSFENFDRYKQKVFINGKLQQEFSHLGEIEVPYGDLVVRIEQPGLRHFVVSRRLDETTPNLKIHVDDQPIESYGQLVTTASCARGKIFFELFGEKRVEEVPIRMPILFPVGNDGHGNLSPASYTIAFQKDGEDFQRKISFTVNYQDDSIDFCSILN